VICAAAWQQVTGQWWAEERAKYELFISESVITEASGGDQHAADSRLRVLRGVAALPIDAEVRGFGDKLIEHGGVPPRAEADAYHIAATYVHEIDYLLTWNCRHIDNAATKPVIRSICAVSGYACPEICTPLELPTEEPDDV
jgi:hypothetical protein